MHITHVLYSPGHASTLCEVSLTGKCGAAISNLQAHPHNPKALPPPSPEGLRHDEGANARRRVAVWTALCAGGLRRPRLQGRGLRVRRRSQDAEPEPTPTHARGDMARALTRARRSGAAGVPRAARAPLAGHAARAPLQRRTTPRKDTQIGHGQRYLCLGAPLTTSQRAGWRPRSSYASSRARRTSKRTTSLTG